ncbi:MAG: HYR domain-containing protein, partial [Flavobacteriales bacterium]|nr:HYR domain-containing protein [Flavobacteriales bacterium]
MELVNDLTGETLDIFGEIGEDPGSQWSVDGNGTADRTLRRKASVIDGNTENASGFPTLGTEWDGFEQDDVSGLGSHESETGGGTPVTYTAEDAGGNTTERTVLVIVKDELAPTFESCPEDITQSGEVLLNGAVVNFNLPVSDNCTEDVALTQTSGLASGEIFPIGTTTNTFEATDASGNTTICSFDVTIEEIEPYASFELTPSTTEPALCDEFTVMVAVQTTDVINLAEIQLNFDPEALEVISVTAPGGGELPAAPLGSEVEDESVIDNENGLLSYAAFSVSTPYPNSDFDFVEITFKALGSSGETTISPILNGFPKSLIAITNPFLPVPTAIDLLTGANSVVVSLQEDATPPIAICNDEVTVYLDENGEAVVTPEQVDNGSFDACTEVELSLDQSIFNCDYLPEIGGLSIDPGAIGSSTVTLTVTDEAGNIATCTADVIVLDEIAPDAVCENITVELNELGEASIDAEMLDGGSTDNCETLSFEASQTTFDCEDLGENQVELTVTDGSGNSTTCMATVTVVDDLAPVEPTLTDVTGECEATATAPTTTDNCADVVTGTTDDPLTYTEQGEYTITWTFDDGNGNTSMADQTVIVDDVTAPEEPTLADVTGECEATATAPTATDNCAGDVTGTTDDPLTYTEQGEHTITWTFADGNGNSTTAEQTVVVNDVTAPETPTLADVTGECEATATAPTTTDNCAGVVTGTTDDPLTYTAQGTYTITWTFADGNGNSTTADQTVVVNDETAPEMPTLADVTGECEATATAPTTTDNCAGVVTGTTDDPLTYTAQGTYTITWTFDDGNGNSITADQTVIVDDVTAPEVPTLDNVTGECEATATAPTTTDICAGEVTGTTDDPLTYTDQGEHTITWTFADGNGNSTTAEQTVVVNDVTAPEMPTLADVTGECEATATEPTTTDNCAGVVTGTTDDPLTYTEQDEYTITWTFDDGNGNTSTAEQTVVIADETEPEITCAADASRSVN